MITGAPCRAFASLLLLVIAFGTPAAVAAAAADFKQDVQAATQTTQESQAQREQLIVEGKLDQAIALLLNAFPEKTRTAAQAFALGDALFELDRAASYKLHKRAYELAPNEPTVAFEWAKEQHRAGEYAAALPTYQKVSGDRLESVMSYALQADCLLHLGRFDDAAAAWVKSQGVLDSEEMEKIVCAVKREPMPHARRAALLKRATQQKDVQAAIELVLLDCEFPNDWWSIEVNQPFLDHDAPAVLAALNLPKTDPRRRGIECAAALGAIKADDADLIKQTLLASGFLVDAAHTFPPHATLAEYLMHRAMRPKQFSDAELHDTLLPILLKQARANGTDAGWWEAARLCVRDQDLDARLKLALEAWKASGDPRFAQAALSIRRANGELPEGDAGLDGALKQFPDDAGVQRIGVLQAEGYRRLTKPILAQAAQAEFKHYSLILRRGTVIPRPRADYLQDYLEKISLLAPAKTAPSPAKPAPAATPGKPNPTPLPF